MFTIKVTPEYGRGLYATRDLEPGETIAVCELLVLSPEHTLKVNETDLQYYTFVYNEKQDCLVLGDGEIFNHSDTANVSYKLQDLGDGRQGMIFVTNNYVKSGEQLFIDYSADIRVDTSAYIGKNLL